MKIPILCVNFCMLPLLNKSFLSNPKVFRFESTEDKLSLKFHSSLYAWEVSTSHNIPQGQGLLLTPYPKCQVLCLAHSGHSVNICWMNSWSCSRNHLHLLVGKENLIFTGTLLLIFNFGGQEQNYILYFLCKLPNISNSEVFFYQYLMKDVNITQNNSINLASNWAGLIILLSSNALFWVAKIKNRNETTITESCIFNPIRP